MKLTFSSTEFGLVACSTAMATAIVGLFLAQVREYKLALLVLVVVSGLCGVVAYCTNEYMGGLRLGQQLAGCIAAIIAAGCFLALFSDDDRKSTVHTGQKSSDLPVTRKLQR